MRGLTFTLLLFLILSSTCASHKDNDLSESISVDPPAIESVDETYLVYSAVLNQKFPSKQILIEDQTGVGLLANEFQNSHIAGLSDETVQDYNAKQIDMVQPLEDNFAGTFRATFLRQNDKKRLFGKPENLTSRFYHAYPKSAGIVTFSRIGFNADKTQALLSVSHWCGGQCGTGTFYFIRKQDGKWTVQWEQGIWVS